MVKIDLSWAEVDGLISLLSNEIYLSDKNFSGICGVSDGGKIISILLHKRLDIPLLNQPQNRCLLVDEAVDSGKRLKKLQDEHLSTVVGGLICTAALIESKKSQFSPDFTGRLVGYQDWIVFPWDYDIHAVENVNNLI